MDTHTVECRPLSPTSVSGIRVEYSQAIVSGSKCPPILVVSFSGEYRYGGEGEPDAEYMKAMVHVGASLWGQYGVILDLTGLVYHHGYALVTVFLLPGLIRQLQNSRYYALLAGGRLAGGMSLDDALRTWIIPTSIVVSSKCRGGIESLKTHVLSFKLSKEEMPYVSIVDDIPQAARAVARQFDDDEAGRTPAFAPAPASNSPTPQAG